MSQSPTNIIDDNSINSLQNSHGHQSIPLQLNQYNELNHSIVSRSPKYTPHQITLADPISPKQQQKEMPEIPSKSLFSNYFNASVQNPSLYLQNEPTKTLDGYQNSIKSSPNSSSAISPSISPIRVHQYSNPTQLTNPILLYPPLTSFPVPLLNQQPPTPTPTSKAMLSSPFQNPSKKINPHFLYSHISPNTIIQPSLSINTPHMAYNDHFPTHTLPPMSSSLHPLQSSYQHYSHQNYLQQPQYQDRSNLSTISQNSSLSLPLTDLESLTIYDPDYTNNSYQQYSSQVTKNRLWNQTEYNIDNINTAVDIDSLFDPLSLHSDQYHLPSLPHSTHESNQDSKRCTCALVTLFQQHGLIFIKIYFLLSFIFTLSIAFLLFITNSSQYCFQLLTLIPWGIGAYINSTGKTKQHLLFFFIVSIINNLLEPIRLMIVLWLLQVYNYRPLFYGTSHDDDDEDSHDKRARSMTYDRSNASHLSQSMDPTPPILHDNFNHNASYPRLHYYLHRFNDATTFDLPPRFVAFLSALTSPLFLIFSFGIGCFLTILHHIGIITSKCTKKMRKCVINPFLYTLFFVISSMYSLFYSIATRMNGSVEIRSFFRSQKQYFNDVALTYSRLGQYNNVDDPFMDHTVHIQTHMDTCDSIDAPKTLMNITKIAHKQHPCDVYSKQTTQTDDICHQTNDSISLSVFMDDNFDFNTQFEKKNQVAILPSNLHIDQQKLSFPHLHSFRYPLSSDLQQMPVHTAHTAPLLDQTMNIASIQSTNDSIYGILAHVSSVLNTSSHDNLKNLDTLDTSPKNRTSCLSNNSNLPHHIHQYPQYHVSLNMFDEIDKNVTKTTTLVVRSNFGIIPPTSSTHNDTGDNNDNIDNNNDNNSDNNNDNNNEIKEIITTNDNKITINSNNNAHDTDTNANNSDNNTNNFDLCKNINKATNGACLLDNCSPTAHSTVNNESRFDLDSNAMSNIDNIITHQTSAHVHAVVSPTTVPITPTSFSMTAMAMIAEFDQLASSITSLIETTNTTRQLQNIDYARPSINSRSNSSAHSNDSTHSNASSLPSSISVEDLKYLHGETILNPCMISPSSITMPCPSNIDYRSACDSPVLHVVVSTNHDHTFNSSNEDNISRIFIDAIEKNSNEDISSIFINAIAIENTLSDSNENNNAIKNTLQEDSNQFRTPPSSLSSQDEFSESY